MKKIWHKICKTTKGHFISKRFTYSDVKDLKTSQMTPERARKIEKGAKDFAERFEGVMKELANG